MGSEKKTIEERLTEQLDKKDEVIRELEAEVNQLKNQLRNSANGVYAHRLLSSKQTLPVPRLEITVTPDGDKLGKWYKREYDYRLVIHAEWGDIIAIPFSRTSSMGGPFRNEKPVHAIGPHAGQPEVPFRLAHYICHDMRSLALPGFVICEELVRDISGLADKPNEL